MLMISRFIFNNHYIFSGLPQDDKDLLLQVMKTRKYRKNETIFTEGREPLGIFFVRSGKVKIYKADNDQREQIIYIYGTGEFFGYAAVLSESFYVGTTVAIESAVIGFISADDFMAVLKKSTVFTRLLLKSLSHEFIVMANLAAVLSQRTVRERVALSLLILNDKYRNENESREDVCITLSRRDLAKMAGTVSETLARVLHDFKEEGLILAEGRKIQLLNFERLVYTVNFL